MVADNKTERSERAEVSAVPLYQQVMDDLKGEIARGVYASGSRIPSEIELAKSYGVGRVTVRRAIEELSRAGYLNRQQGRGTFVCAPKLKRKIHQKGDVQSFTEGCAANDMVAGARLVSRTVVAATREDAAFFGVEPGSELIVVERVRTADGIPVMLENNAFVLADHPYLQTLADKDLADNSIFALVAEHSGRAPLKSDPCTVEIALADAQAAPLLEVPVGEPLKREATTFTSTVYTAREFCLMAPKSLGPKALVIACSHSGNTQEVVDGCELRAARGKVFDHSPEVRRCMGIEQY